MKALRMLGCMAVVTIPLMADLAFAQGAMGPPFNPPGPPSGIKPAPAPLIGVGLPMAGGVLGAPACSPISAETVGHVCPLGDPTNCALRAA